MSKALQDTSRSAQASKIDPRIFLLALVLLLLSLRLSTPAQEQTKSS